jgi:PAS domain S-box-containing protein
MAGKDLKSADAVGISYNEIKLLGEIGQQITATLSVEEIIRKTYKNVNSLMDATVFDIGIYNKELNRLDSYGGIEKGEELPFSFYNLNDKLRPAVWCFKNQKAFYTNDYRNDYNTFFPGAQVPETVAGDRTYSIIYLPLTIQEKKIGVITVQSMVRNAYTPHHLDILTNLAVYVATALENARLYRNMEDEVKLRTLEIIAQKEELEISNKNIQLLSELGQQITATLSVEEIVNKTYKNINGLMDATGLLIGIHDAENNRLVFPGGMEKGVKIPLYSYQLDDKNRSSVHCFNNQEEMVMNDYANDFTRFFPNVPVPRPSVGELPASLIYIPLTVQDKRIGVLSVQSFKKNAYNDYHLSILRNLAVYVSIALENARHYEDMEQKVLERTKEVVGQKEELEKQSMALQQSYDNINLLGKIGQQITSTLNLENVLNIVYEHVNKLMDASSFVIGYYDEPTQKIQLKLGIENKQRLPYYEYDMSDKTRLAVWCVDNKQEVFINENSENSKYVAYIPPVIAGDMTQSVMYLPLIVEDKVIGTISAQSFQKHAYTSHHLEIFRTLAAYTAVALNNAEAYKQLNLAMEDVEKLSIVASKSENIIAICNTDTELIWANDAFTQSFGYSLEEFKQLKGKTIYEISSNPDIRNMVADCIARKTGVVYESKNITKNKGERWYQTALSPVFDDSGVLRNIVFIDSDITQLKLIGEQLHQKNKEVVDSLYYARRIQTALFTSDYYIKKYISEYLIFFQPKDIVSGDFYWMLHQNDCLYVAIADCTGHGVPGAFMSMMGINLLNDIIIARNISNPALVLDIMREEIVNSLNPEGAEEEARDGMDMVLCKFDFKNKQLDFSAANNSLYLMRQGILTEYKGDKMPVGKGNDHVESFSKQTLRLEEGDIIYAFTDGYPDQFGGPKGKKFKYKKLEDLLLANAEKPMSLQKRQLKKTFEEWKDNLEQVDDVLVIGIKI